MEGAVPMDMPERMLNPSLSSLRLAVSGVSVHVELSFGDEW